MQRRGTALTDVHVAAGEIFEFDYEFGQRGAFRGAPSPEVKGSFGPRDYARSLDRARSFRAAQQAVGPIGASLLEFCVLGTQGAPPGNLSAWAAARRATDPKAMGENAAAGALIVALDVLANHYGPRRIDDWIARRYAEAA
jgi:hypothetical protein